jgi:hypothetical protein
MVLEGSAEQQVRLFHDAEFIAGVHGAALPICCSPAARNPRTVRSRQIQAALFSWPVPDWTMISSGGKGTASSFSMTSPN